MLLQIIQITKILFYKQEAKNPFIKLIQFFFLLQSVQNFISNNYICNVYNEKEKAIKIILTQLHFIIISK